MAASYHRDRHSRLVFGRRGIRVLYYCKRQALCREKAGRGKRPMSKDPNAKKELSAGNSFFFFVKRSRGDTQFARKHRLVPCGRVLPGQQFLRRGRRLAPGDLRREQDRGLRLSQGRWDRDTDTVVIAARVFRRLEAVPARDIHELLADQGDAQRHDAG